ncbi:MAG TPA: error-prone DNA polymerase [Candidatus Limnocylindria bacterium]|nr:error-prone DNA polymerase [Candidatus Limnocylindria bacterium]
MGAPNYIELRSRSAFSFLRGASLPEHLADRAAKLGLPALAMSDRMGLYGAPRLFSSAKERGIRPIIGSELVMSDGTVLPVLVESRVGYRNLCRLLTQAHLRADKNTAAVAWEELPAFAEGLVALTGDEEGPLGRAFAKDNCRAVLDQELRRLTRIFGPGSVFVEVQRHLLRGEERRNRLLFELAKAQRVPLLATNGVAHAEANGREVLDVFTCLRHHTHLDAAGAVLTANSERHLKSAEEMAALFADHPPALANTVRLADRLQFSLDDLGYEFPRYPVGPGETMPQVLREITYIGARKRYGASIPQKTVDLLEKELALISKLKFDGYFLIVADLMRFCRENGIMAQGRGSAANSAVCYCLGITIVDPARFNVLFERFLSEGRKDWPDIDIDLPSGDCREKVIQEVYQRYGKHGAAMTGVLITYRGRSSAREIGKALNFPVDILDRFSNLFAHGDYHDTMDLSERMAQAGLEKTHPRAGAFSSLYRRLARLPRHLGQHPGGMIICQDELSSFMPLENATMPGRVVAQWDKDDCDDLGIVKVDLLGLGMMSALQDTVALSNARGRPVDLAHLPEYDQASFELIQKADTIGVFQIESRAQMATLPRMKPNCFYDLVIEVAIIRPGPIQGDLAHPFLRRRMGEEPVTYYDPLLEPILKRTLGIPLFQEQMLEIAMKMAGFSGAEAEDLRKAMSFHRSDERMERAVTKLRAAMELRKVNPETIGKIVKAVGSFALYGFPESHAISFAYLAYSSVYLKVHRAPEFYCALLNNQPMGFYSSATLIKDAKRRHVAVRPVCLARSEWKCTVEKDGSLRLGFRQVEGLRENHVQLMLEQRAVKAFVSVEDLKARTRFSKDELRTLAEIGALNAVAPHRRAALWETERTQRVDELFNGSTTAEPSMPLQPMDAVERLKADYSGLRLTTGPHPMALIRDRLPDVWVASALAGAEDGQFVRIAGQVICRQRPGTAKGVCFVSLEDETGIANAIVSAKLFETERLKITTEPFLIVNGIAQNRHNTIHIKALKIERLPYASLETANSHDFQ